MPISAIMPIFNEEERIESTLRTLLWCDEIIVIDKNSTDKSRQIAEKYGAKVFIFYEKDYDPSEVSFALEKCTYDWVISFTASDIIHPNLALKLKELTNLKDFEYDTISIPFYTYILGIDSKRSPWHTDQKRYVFRKTALTLNMSVHHAIKFNSERNYEIKNSSEFCVYHLTHESVNIMMERHIRYWKGEALYFNDSDLKNSFKKVVKEFMRVIFKKKSYLMGWNGIMLSFAFLSYYMMSFVYKWEKKYGNAPAVYKKMRNDIIAEWEKMK
jgi:glycosyltransferase involved in cell wall biosynthesis